MRKYSFVKSSQLLRVSLLAVAAYLLGRASAGGISSSEQQSVHMVGPDVPCTVPLCPGRDVQSLTEFTRFDKPDNFTWL